MGNARPPGCPSLVPPCLLHSVVGSEADGAPADGSCCCTIETGPRPASLRGQQPQEEVDPVLVTILQLQWRTKGLCLFTNPYLGGVFSRASTLAAFPPRVPAPFETSPPALPPACCQGEERAFASRPGRVCHRAVAGGVRWAGPGPGGPVRGASPVLL